MRFLLAVSLAAILLASAPAVVSASTTYFASPSKSIGCLYGRFEGVRSLRCDLARVDHPKPTPASCPLDYGDAFGLRVHGKASRVCHGDTVLNPRARVLAYGKTKHFGPFTCRVRKAGFLLFEGGCAPECAQSDSVCVRAPSGSLRRARRQIWTEPG